MSGSVQSLSFSVAMSGLAHWRSFFLTRLEGTMAAATWALKGKETSQVLQWITSTFADQELYKKYYSAMEHAEKVLTGADQDDWVLEKARYIRVESERRANVVRCAAGSCVLLALRTGHLWAEGEGRCLFQSFSSVFATAPHTMEPPFVKPTPPELVLYAAEVLHVLLHLDAEHEEPVVWKPNIRSSFWLVSLIVSIPSDRQNPVQAYLGSCVSMEKFDNSRNQEMEQSDRTQQTMQMRDHNKEDHSMHAANRSELGAVADVADSKEQRCSTNRTQSRSRSAPRQETHGCHAHTRARRTHHRHRYARQVSRCPSPHRCRPEDYALRRRTLAAELAQSGEVEGQR
eukprot:symbB.v1.2.033221.t1/scaffold4091.1/size47958/2